MERERLDFEMLNEVRRSLKTHASKIGTCDGSDKEHIRKWIRKVFHMGAIRTAKYKVFLSDVH